MCLDTYSILPHSCIAENKIQRNFKVRNKLFNNVYYKTLYNYSFVCNFKKKEYCYSYLNDIKMLIINN